jgi:hypothetical protein
VPCHLVTYLEATGISWKAYQEDIDGTACPVADKPLYAARHDPFVYFEDVSGKPPSMSSARCIAHVRPYSELQADLQASTVARYNFITPNLCNDGHDSCAPYHDQVRQSAAWLERELRVPERRRDLHHLGRGRGRGPPHRHDRRLADGEARLRRAAPLLARVHAAHRRGALRRHAPVARRGHGDQPLRPLHGVPLTAPSTSGADRAGGIHDRRDRPTG